jgi:glutathione peroxidase
MNLIPILACVAFAAAAVVAPLSAAEGTPKNVYDVTMAGMDGKPHPLAQYKGQVMMIVNVASKCGNTPQYTALEASYEKFKGQGFTILGVPANNFGGQEPGSNDEIKEFCTSKYNVTFPMVGKVSVKGDDMVPLYKYLTTSAPKTGDVGWNFAKFLINRKGEVIDRFDPKTKPDDPAVVAAIEKALKEPAPKH